MTPYTMDIKGQCLVPGCDMKATHILNLRMRMLNTNAVKGFGKNIRGAVFCEKHGHEGADIVISYTPRTDGKLLYAVESGDARVSFRTFIRDDDNGEQDSLL